MNEPHRRVLGAVWSILTDRYYQFAFVSTLLLTLAALLVAKVIVFVQQPKPSQIIITTIHEPDRDVSTVLGMIPYGTSPATPAQEHVDQVLSR